MRTDAQKWTQASHATHRASSRPRPSCGGHDHGDAEGDLMELNGWASPQMLRRYGASARSARARRTYDRIMTDT